MIIRSPLQAEKQLCSLIIDMPCHAIDTLLCSLSLVERKLHAPLQTCENFFVAQPIQIWQLLVRHKEGRQTRCSPPARQRKTPSRHHLLHCLFSDGLPDLHPHPLPHTHGLTVEVATVRSRKRSR